MLTVGNQIKVTAIDLDYLGQGVVKHEGYVIFVPKLLDTEEAIIEITKINKNFGEAKIIKLIKISQDRVTSSNQNLGSTEVSHMSIKKQLDFQIKTTKETLKKIANIDVNTSDIITDYQDKSYRNKVLFHVLEDKYLKLGLFDESNRNLVQVKNFVLANPKVNEVLEYLYAKKIEIDSKIFKHMIFRTNKNQELLITIVSLKPRFIGLNELINELILIQDIVGITLNIKDDHKSNLGKKSLILYKNNLMTQYIGNKQFYINDKSFFQVNSNVIEMVYNKIKNLMIPNQIAIDLYSGVGSIGFFIQDQQKNVIMVESNQDSINMALMTKEKYNYQNVDIIKGFAEKEINELDGDILIVDPPRNGLFTELITEIINKSFKQIFYLSCDLKTLSRDLKLLTNHYEIVEVIPIKMFFHTNEFETLVIMKGRS
jgi:23S rRNA (uracil1939-C5)-methyltransferase